jgi:hypothetical protein
MGTSYSHSWSEGHLPLDDPLELCAQHGHSPQVQAAANGAVRSQQERVICSHAQHSAVTVQYDK